jgi:hypothetical protein
LPTPIGSSHTALAALRATTPLASWPTSTAGSNSASTCRAEAIAHIQNTNSQYSHPPFGLKLGYATNRAELDIADRFSDPSVKKTVEIDLADHYTVTVVLCTATQPALTSHASFCGLHGVREIITNRIRPRILRGSTHVIRRTKVIRDNLGTPSARS